MSRSDHSIFDSTEEAALTLTLVAKGMIHVDDFPEKMRTGTSKVMMEVSGRFLIQSDNEKSSSKQKGEVIHNSFGKDEVKKMGHRVLSLDKPAKQPPEYLSEDFIPQDTRHCGLS